MANAKGSLIRMAREKKGMTLSELSSRVGKTAPYISDIERGNRRGTYQTLEKIANELDLNINDIWEVA